MSSAILNTEALYIGFWFNQWENMFWKLLLLTLLLKLWCEIPYSHRIWKITSYHLWYKIWWVGPLKQCIFTLHQAQDVAKCTRVTVKRNFFRANMCSVWMAAKAAKWGIVLFWATLISAENKLFLTFLLGSAEESKHVRFGMIAGWVYERIFILGELSL